MSKQATKFSDLNLSKQLIMALDDLGFEYPTPIQEKWAEHISKKHNWQYYLWDVLMFQVWLEASRN